MLLTLRNSSCFLSISNLELLAFKLRLIKSRSILFFAINLIYFSSVMSRSKRLLLFLLRIILGKLQSKIAISRILEFSSFSFLYITIFSFSISSKPLNGISKLLILFMVLWSIVTRKQFFSIKESSKAFFSISGSNIRGPTLQ